MAPGYISDKHSKTLLSSPYVFSILALVLLTAVIAAGFNLHAALDFWQSILISINIATFILCGYDKSVANTPATRIPEIVFFGAALCGGSIGLITGMNIFRHKIQKVGFSVVVIAILVLQLLVLNYL